jgi:hypothetical protein
MYLVELRPGREELYRTSDDLALAIRDGEVDARSRIYHRSTAKWISITLHPQYKAIVAGPMDDSLLRPIRKVWGLLPALSGQDGESLSTDEEPTTAAGSERWKRPLGLGLAGVLLVMGIQLASSGPRPPRSGKDKPVAAASAQRMEQTARIQRAETTERIESADEPELLSVARMNTTWPGPDELGLELEAPITPPVEVTTAPARKASVLPKAPRLRAKALRAALVSSGVRTEPVKAHSVQAVLTRYEAASDAALARLEAGLRVARLDRLFSSARLTPGGGVTQTRMGLAGAANFIRIFRQQQAAIDAAYQDSITVLAKRHRWRPKDVRLWYSRPQRKEEPTLELLGGTLLASIDSVLGLLGDQAGAYKLRGTAIAFEDPTAAQAYGMLRRRIKEQIGSAVAAGGATSPGPTSYLLQAIGRTSLPRET